MVAPLLGADEGRQPRPVGRRLVEVADQQQAHRGAVDDRVELARELLLAGDPARHVALLVARLAGGVGLGPLLGHPHERDRGAEQRRAAHGLAEVEVGARGLLILGDHRVERGERGALGLVAGRG